MTTPNLGRPILSRGCFYDNWKFLVLALVVVVLGWIGWHWESHRPSSFFMPGTTGELAEDPRFAPLRGLIGK